MLLLFCRSAALCGSLILWLGTLYSAFGADSKPASLHQAAYGEIYYTQFSLFHDRHVHETTNYRRTTLVPINTPVAFVRFNIVTGGQGPGRLSPLVYPEIIVKLPNGNELCIKNVQKYSGEDLDGIFARTFGKDKVDLTSFTPLERTNILEGKVADGMSKAAVLRAMGYPPKHRTPSLSSDRWIYWSSRAGNFAVRFTDDKVISVN